MCHKNDLMVKAMVKHYPTKNLVEIAEKAGLPTDGTKLELVMRVVDRHYDDFKWEGKSA